MKRKLLTLFGVWFVTTFAIALFYRLQFVSPLLRDYMSLITTTLLIYMPMLATWKCPNYIPLFEKNFAEVRNSLTTLALTCAVIFPAIAGLNHLFQGGTFNFALPQWLQLHRHFNPTGIQYRALAEALAYQILLVGLPEEFFFRGYMQTVLNEYFGKPWRIFGAQIGWSLILTSLIFALSHSLISFAWWHFSIFFPSLVFGWLREKTGRLSAGILFHAFCNVFSLWVGMAYR